MLITPLKLALFCCRLGNGGEINAEHGRSEK